MTILTFQVIGVIIHSRRHCCITRLYQTRVSVGNSNISLSSDNVIKGLELFNKNTHCGTISQGSKSQCDSFHVGCDPPVIGQFVLIQKVVRRYLELEEMDVIEVKDVEESELWKYKVHILKIT